MKLRILTFAALITSVNSRFTRNIEAPEEATLECTVTETDGYVLQGMDPIDPELVCTTDNDEVIILDGDIYGVFGDSLEFGHTRLTIPQSAVSDDYIVNVSDPNITIMVDNDHTKRRQLTNTGSFKVLVVIVKDRSGNRPSQNAAQMANDVFLDENNLRVRFDECSNGKLKFVPATGPGVVNGAIEVTTQRNLNGLSWRTCGNLGLAALPRGINREYTMFICPNVVNFERAAAWGQRPGRLTWYSSRFASYALVQSHELGHNLGLRHSGTPGTTKDTVYTDSTCQMGNKGDWTDIGSKFCFNPSKTWTLGWYSDHHKTLTPQRNAYDGVLVGINAVRDRTITVNQDVVLRIDDMHIMFNRAVGANAGVPGYKDQVIITTEKSSDKKSTFQRGLSSGQRFTRGNLLVEVCNINLSGSGSARILVYTRGVNDLTCDRSPTPPSPTPPSPTPPGSGGLEDKFVFVPFMDSSGNDIKWSSGGSINAYMSECNNNPACVGFNSNGWMKHTLIDRSMWTKWTTDPSKGFYTKKSQGGNGGGDSEYSSYTNGQFPTHCLHLSAPNNRNDVSISSCSGGSNQQKWKLDSKGFLRSQMNENKCMVASSDGSNGNRVFIYDCDDKYTYMKWIRDSAGRFRLKTKSGQCLDVKNGTRNLHMWECNQYKDKIWNKK